MRLASFVQASLLGLFMALLIAFTPCGCVAQTNLVDSAASWSYRKGLSAPQADWKTAATSGLDASWLTGKSGFGYADNATETQLCQTLLNDMRGNYTTVAMRNSFEAGAELDPAWRLQLTTDYDDGFIAWLDGIYLVSANSPGAPAEPAFTSEATASHESSRGSAGNPPAVIDLGPVGTRLPPGTHVLSIVGLNQSASSSDFIQLTTLALVTNAPPATNCLSGLLTSDRILSATNSPHLICADLTVTPGVTLTIEPGTTVQLARDAGLIVAVGGRVLAEGSDQAHIQFNAAQSSVAWSGITINGAEGSPQSRIAYADFDGNGTTCIELAGGDLSLEHVTFRTTSHRYLSLDDSAFLISHCYFPSSTAPFELVHGTGGIRTGGRGIVRDCYFGTTSGYNDIVDFTGGNRRNQPIVQFYNNVFAGATDDILDLDGTDAWIEGNIFLHCHKNGAPDSSAAVSGGNSGTATSEITLVRNLFFDCDQAATAKQGNFYTFMNNTMVLMTKTGGVDTAAGVVNLRDLDPGPPTTFGAGCYLENNIVVDAEQLIRNYDAQRTQVTFLNNVLPQPWTVPGSSNIIADPLLKHVPQLSETQFTNWTDAQVLWDWFSLQPGSPALGAGTDGRDIGAVIPAGVSLRGEPVGTTGSTSASLAVSFNRTGHGIPTDDWPLGSGYVAYRWRLDDEEWSTEAPLGQAIVLTNLAAGPHQVSVIGKNDAGFYQNDPALGADGVVTLSGAWVVEPGFGFSEISQAGNEVTLQIQGEPLTPYSIEYRDEVSQGAWLRLQDLTTDQAGIGTAIDSSAIGPSRFYRLLRSP